MVVMNVVVLTVRVLNLILVLGVHSGVFNQDGEGEADQMARTGDRRSLVFSARSLLAFGPSD